MLIDASRCNSCLSQRLLTVGYFVSVYSKGIVSLQTIEAKLLSVRYLDWCLEWKVVIRT